MLDIEVAYALADKQKIVQLQVPAGTTVRQAALQSGLERDFPGLDLANSPLGLPFFTWFFPLSPSPIASLRSFQKFGSKGRIVFCAVTASLVAEHILPITGGFRKAYIVTDTG